MNENIALYWQDVSAWMSTAGLSILIILIGAFVVARVLRLVMNRLLNLFRRDTRTGGHLKRLETLRSVVNSIISVIVWIVAAMIILDKLGLNIGPVLATAGVVGIAVGFGAQQLVQDVISGFFILIEDQIRVGDVVQIADKAGLVERVNLRMTILRDLSGNVHYVRNGQIATVTNMTQEFSFAVFDIGVAYREDVDAVIDIMRETAHELRDGEEVGDDVLEDIEVLGLDKFADSAVVIKARIKTKPIRQWAVMREYNRLLKKAFDQRDIEIPFPHVTVYMGADKDGSAAPLHVANASNGMSPTEG